MNYFEQTDYVSNSDLTALKRLQSSMVQRDLTQAYAFGNLVDAMQTEKHKVLHDELGWVNNDGKVITFEAEQFEKAKLMTQAADADSTIKLMLSSPGAKTQHEVYRKAFQFEYQGIQFEMPMRCKLDFSVKLTNMRAGADLKTTACTNRMQFIESVEFLDYDRQGALYMDLYGIDMFWIIGVSKKKNRLTHKHEIYRVVIRRGDDLHSSGVRKYSRLAYQYYTLIYKLIL